MHTVENSDGKNSQLRKIHQKLSLTQEFMIISLVILLSGMFMIGWWVANRIENAVIEHGAVVTTLYMNTFIPPLLEDMTKGQNIDDVHQHMLRHLLTQTPLTDNIISLNVWTPDHRLVYSSVSPTLSETASISRQVDAVINGEIVSQIFTSKQQGETLIQTYVPVFDNDNNSVTAVVESYQNAVGLQTQVRYAQYQSWFVVGVATAIMYLLLSSLVQGADRTINRQKVQLKESVKNLESLLNENRSLKNKLQLAAVRVNEINEQFLNRLGRDLHDGPAQDIALALLHIRDISDNTTPIDMIHHALESALGEIRAIAAGLQLPELEKLSLHDVARRALRDFKRKTNVDVDFDFSDHIPDTSIAKKQIIYRAMTEIMNNAYKHASTTELKGCLQVRNNELFLEISDSGVGFDPNILYQDHDHLGLAGLQQRVMLIDGWLGIQSEPNRGTVVNLTVPIGDTIT